VLFGDVWRRPELSPRDRNLVTISVLIATGKPAQLAATWAERSTTAYSQRPLPFWRTW
jgi:alkylhydroperoxidase/carboxymuconolactone decarboxylase family protein YurZ